VAQGHRLLQEIQFCVGKSLLHCRAPSMCGSVPNRVLRCRD
jgi:hypothetical protein